MRKQPIWIPKRGKLLFMNSVPKGQRWWNNFTWAWFEIGEYHAGLSKLKKKMAPRNKDGSVAFKWRHHKAQAYLRTLVKS